MSSTNAGGCTNNRQAKKRAPSASHANAWASPGSDALVHHQGSVALDESDNDELQSVRLRPKVDVSQLTGEKCIKILGAHTDRSAWPERTTVSCWHCTFPFDSIPLSIPSKYAHNSKLLTNCYGVFCSFNCARAYCITLNRHNCWQHLQLLSYLHKQLLGNTVKIKPAGPFQALTRFGGYMDIDEYRKDFITLPPSQDMFDDSKRRDHVRMLELNCIPLFQTVLHSHNQQLTDSIMEKNVRREAYDRTKPLPGSEVLATSMGIVRY